MGRFPARFSLSRRSPVFPEGPRIRGLIAAETRANRPKTGIESEIFALFRKIEKIPIENPLSYGKY
jgi:hypothetical protein